jgi:hypothetical protein
MSYSSPSKSSLHASLEPEVSRSGAGGTRRPSLLPAFEPLSSSPFPHPTSAKRKFDEGSPTYPKNTLLKYYPTPVPTSSTGMVPSSPQNVRPTLNRAISALSERQPLGAVPTVDLPADGEILRMGRSSNSSDYQLSANRLISRVHVQAAYHAPTASSPNGYIEVECLGWNGAKIHCKGRVFELNKGDTYMSENPEAEIMLDVQDTRVMLAWPVIPRKLSWDSEDELTPPRKSARDPFASSPPIVPRSPVSQSPIRQPVFSTAPAVPDQAQTGAVQIFEDEDVQDENADPKESMTADETFIRPSHSRSNFGPGTSAVDPKASVLSSFAADDFSEAENEENDPIVHSFGPFGENLLPRLASFSTTTPKQPERRRAALASSSPPRATSSSSFPRYQESPIKNHVINQLAYSRLHSQPLSLIHGNLPSDLKACIRTVPEDKAENGSGTTTPVPDLSTQELKKLMDDIACIGEIPRSGKDAAGQPLENEFYYLPELDTDMLRRETVTVGMRGGTGLRAVRRQHKVSRWLLLVGVVLTSLFSNITGRSRVSRPHDIGPQATFPASHPFALGSSCRHRKSDRLSSSQHVVHRRRPRKPSYVCLPKVQSPRPRNRVALHPLFTCIARRCLYHFLSSFRTFLSFSNCSRIPSVVCVYQTFPTPHVCSRPHVYHYLSFGRICMSELGWSVHLFLSTLFDFASASSL